MGAPIQKTSRRFLRFILAASKNFSSATQHKWHHLHNILISCSIKRDPSALQSRWIANPWSNPIFEPNPMESRHENLPQDPSRNPVAPALCLLFRRPKRSTNIALRRKAARCACAAPCAASRTVMENLVSTTMRTYGGRLAS
jgi:hypothetical protein